MLKTTNLEFAYNDNNSFQFPDIECKQGEHWLVIGPSGCGKTTLLHLIAGLLKPHKGNIEIHNTNLVDLHPSKLDRFRGQNVGIIFQKPYFIRSLNVQQNLLLAQYLAGVKQDKKRITDVLQKLNIEDKANEKPDNLSQGEQQRLSIARAMINDPKVILADEPTSSLDDKNCEEAFGLLESWAKEQQASLFIVTHDQRLKDKFSNQVQL